MNCVFPAKPQASALLSFPSLPKMASISSFKQFISNPVRKTSQRPQFNPKISNHSVIFTNFCAKQKEPRTISIQEFPKKGTSFVARVAADDEWGEEKEPAYGGGVGVVEEEEPTEIDVLKKKLVGAFYGTNRGLSATSETRAEIVELITQLEAKNPTPAPTEALTLLNGKWILAYTSFAALFPLLARGTLPLVKVEEISQKIDSENFSVQNCVLFSGPLASTSITTNAKFEVRSPKRVQIKFDEGIIGTPQLTDSIEVPENVEILGQKIDLGPFKGILSAVQNTASSVVKSISNQPPLKFPISNTYGESWLLTTFLDQELRISRGDGAATLKLGNFNCNRWYGVLFQAVTFAWEKIV